MKLVRFGPPGNEKPAIEVNGVRYDCSGHFKDWNRSFFLNDGISKLRQLINSGLDGLNRIGTSERWGSPVARPGMILCVGLNYSDHAIESGMDIPSEPVLFMKASNTIAGPFDPVKIPPNSQKTDWEVELGIILGKDVYNLSNENEGEDAIAGYCVINDLSEREFQLEKSGQWVKGKSCPGFSPVGPYLVTKDEIENVSDLRMTLSVNGTTRQDGSTSTMIFKPAFIIQYISCFMKLEAGDIISTGTPPGVGLGMDPPLFLKSGDEVILEIENLGQQKQRMTGYG